MKENTIQWLLKKSIELLNFKMADDEETETEEPEEEVKSEEPKEESEVEEPSEETPKEE